MINDNKQSQRGSPLQRGPLLEPVPQTPNQPYNPLPPAGGGTVFTPGRTVFGRDYATPQESPLATLLGELPKVVDAVGATVEQVKKWEKEDQEKSYVELEETLVQMQADFELEFPKGNAPLERTQQYLRDRLRIITEADSRFTLPEVRTRYLGLVIEARASKRGATLLDERLTLDQSREEFNNLLEKSGRDITVFGTLLETQKSLLQKLEDERKRAQTSGNPESYKILSEEIRNVRNASIQAAVTYAQFDISRTEAQLADNSTNRINQIDTFLDGYGAVLEAYGYTPEELDAVSVGLSREIVSSAANKLESDRAIFATNMRNQVDRLFTVGEDGTSTAAAVINAIPKDELIAVMGIEDRNRLELSTLNSILGVGNVQLNRELFTAAGYSEAEAESVHRAELTRLLELVRNEINVRAGEYKTKRILTLTDNIDQAYMTIRQFGPTTGRSYDDIIAMELERNRLAQGTQLEKSPAEVLETVQGNILKSVTENFTIMATAGLPVSSDRARSEVRALDVALLRAIGIEQRGPGEAPSSMERILENIGFRENKSGYIRQGSVADHIFRNAKLYTDMGNPLEAGNRAVIAFVNAMKTEIQTAVARQDVKATRDAETTVNSVVSGNFSEVQNMSIPDLMIGGFKAAFEAGRSESIPEIFRRSTFEETRAAYLEYVEKNQSPLSYEDIAPSLGFLSSMAINGRVARGSMTRTIAAGMEGTFGYPKAVFEWLSQNFTSNYEAFVQFTSLENPTPEDESNARTALSRLRMLTDAMRTSFTGMTPEAIQRVGSSLKTEEAKRMWNFLEPLITSENISSVNILEDPGSTQRFIDLTLLAKNPTTRFNVSSSEEAEIRRRVQVTFGDRHTYDELTSQVQDPDPNALMASLMIASKSPEPRLGQTIGLYEQLKAVLAEDKRIDMSQVILKTAMNPVPTTVGETLLAEFYKYYDVYTESDGSIQINSTATAQWSGGGLIDSDDAPVSAVESWAQSTHTRWWILPDSGPLWYTRHLNLGNHSTIDQVGVTVDLASKETTRDTESYEGGVRASMEFGADVLLDRLTEDYALDNDQVNALRTRVQSIIDTGLKDSDTLAEARTSVLAEITNLLGSEFQGLEIPVYTNVNIMQLGEKSGPQSLPPPSNDLTNLMRKRGLIPLGHVVNSQDISYQSGINHPYYGGFYSAPNVNMNWKKATAVSSLINGTPQAPYMGFPLPY